MPATEKHGRRHSSVVTVVEAAPLSHVPAHLDMREVRIDTFRASGPGGQHRNKTDSAVRATHLPSGTVATATESRSQQANRKVALDRLRQALSDAANQAHAAAANEAKAAQFDRPRQYTWTAWRDRVVGPTGSASYRRALAGDLAGLLGCAGGRAADGR